MRVYVTVRRGFVGLALISLLFAWLVNFGAEARNSEPHTARNLFAQVETWQHLSSVNGDIETPTANPESDQTYTLVLDIDRDGLNDFVIGTRRGTGPSMVWYRRHEAGWSRHVIENAVFGIEAGGSFHDIDGDSDLDVVAGGDFSSNQIWWWENPYPNFDPNTPWTRRLIKNDGAKTHHDMVFGDFDGDSKVELAYWNQGVNTLSIVDIPSNPKNTQPWPGATVIYTAPADRKPEGLAQADIDLDGKTDIIGGGYWFKHNGGTNFTANLIEYIPYMRVAVGQLIPGGRPEIVQIPGDATGTGKWYQWNGSAWVSQVLPVGTIIHGHSLELGDVDQDGNLDIYIGEMRQTVRNNDTLNPNARALILYGDGQGGFAIEQLSSGIEHHESRLADLDGDGDLDILGKPFIWNVPRLDIWLNLLDEPSEPTATKTSIPEATPTTTPTPMSTAEPCFSLDDWTTHVIDSARPHRAVFIDSADLNGDGYQDIVTGAWWYRNPGAAGGAWQRFAIGASFNQMAAIHDFDGDGLPDILGTKPGNQPHLGNAFVWARNTGGANPSNQFQIIDTGVTAAHGDFLQGVAVASFQPGVTEVILSWHLETLARLDALTVPASPATQAWTLRQFSAVTQSEELSLGDIDGDGDEDLLLGSKWLQNPGGASSWNAYTLYNTSDKPDRNRLVDVNGDGRLDAIVGYEVTGSQPGKLAWYEAPSDRTGAWTEHVIADSPALRAPMSLDVIDVDGDGDPDIVAGEHVLANPSSGRVLLFENVNNGASWINHQVAIGHEHHDGTQFVDSDNDGDWDIISLNWNASPGSSPNYVLLYEQTGCPPAITPTSTPPPGPTNTPAATGTPVNTPIATDTGTAAPMPCPFLVPGNLIDDPGFQQPFQANKNANWTFYSNASATASTTTQDPYQCPPAAQIAITTPGTNVQLYQTGIVLQPNTTYQFTIAARASANRAVQVALAKHTTPYTNYGLNSTLNLTPNWQVFTVNFTTKGFSSAVSDGRLRIAMENSDVAGDFFYFDDIAIAPPGSVPPTPTNTPISGSTATHTPASSPTPTDTSTPAITPTSTNTPPAGVTSTATATGAPVQCPIVVPGNLIDDPGFQQPFQANKNANWTFYSNASAAASTSTQNPYQCPPAAQIAITTPGTNVQLYQTGIVLQPNTTYQFSIAARASANRAVQVALAKHVAPYTNYGLNATINLTPNWQVFTVTFTTKGFSSAVSDGRLRIAMENSDVAGDFFYFDDVAIAPPGSVPPTPTNTPISGSTATHTPVPTATNTPAAPTGVATITVWYGQTQTFGTRDGMRSDPIPWVNILGNVSKPAGYTITSLSYTLNGGPPVALRMGPDNRRLAEPGDFNVEIDRTILQPGDNQVVITAVDNMGGVKTFPVTVVYSSSGNTWMPGPYTVDWNTAAKVTDLAQPVDGQWALVGGGVTATVLDYDRLLAIGDESWRDYTVTVPITIYGIDPSGYAYPSNGPGVGVIVRWPGHYDDGNAISPVEGWRRLGALAWYHWGTNAPGDETLQVYRFGGLPGQIVKTGPLVLNLNTTYIFKVRVQTAENESSPATYQFKVWNASSAEPGAWDLTTPGIIGEPANGSLLLVAHHVNARFGTAQVELTSTTQSSPPTATPTPTNTPEGQAYQVTLAADAGAFARTDKPAETSINFTPLLAAEGQTGAFDPNSLLVVEVDSGDNIIDSAVPFQFDKAANYNAGSNAAGTLVWLLEGNTPANTTRRYRVYFDVTGKGFTPPNFTPLVTVTDNVSHKGYQSLRLMTGSGEYFYHKTGGGFATLLDANANDWIGWNSSTTPSGAAGDFRGIPNMVYPTDGGYFHPGRNTATTALVSQGPLKVTFRSTADNGQWETIWEVYPTYARMTVAKAPAVNYWFLYEGTPGGLLEPGVDTQTRSNGATSPLSTTVSADIPGDEWLYFSDPNVGRSLFLAHHQSDTLIDGYFPMDGLMTVFGFGRNNNGRLLSGAGRQFTIGLVDATAYNTVGPIVYNAYTAVAVTVEGSGAPTSTPTPTATAAAPCPATVPGNLIDDPGFQLPFQANKNANWTFYSNGSATASTTTQNPYQCAPAAQIAITTSGTNVQLYQSGIILQPNTTYQFSFAARASANRAVQVVLAKHATPYTNYGLNATINLTPNWQVFTVTFTTKGFSSAVSDGRLRIALENSDVAGDFFYFDDVAIVPSG